MTEEQPFTASALYTLPDIRTQTNDELYHKLDMIRQRRLLTALEFQSKQNQKLNKEGHKLAEQYHKLVERVAKRIESTKDDINSIDKDMQKLTELHHKLTILE